MDRTIALINWFRNDYFDNEDTPHTDQRANGPTGQRADGQTGRRGMAVGQ
jgi:hypothetical protein